MSPVGYSLAVLSSSRLRFADLYHGGAVFGRGQQERRARGAVYCRRQNRQKCGRFIPALTLKRLGGALKLVNPNQRNLELLLVTQLHTVFEVFQGVQDAVDSFSPHRTVQQFDFLKFFKKAARHSAGE